MTIHPKDKELDNPRIQCFECGKWKRLHGEDEKGLAIQRFFSGCDFTDKDGGDGHGLDDICDDCCKKLHK